MRCVFRLGRRRTHMRLLRRARDTKGLILAAGYALRIL